MPMDPNTTAPAAGEETADRLGVVVGVDGSDQSISAARWAQREAGARGVPLTLVTAYTIPAFWGYAGEVGGQLADDTALREGVLTMLKSVESKLEADGVRPILRVEIGDAAGVLVDLSRDADMLVSGARGRGGFLGRLLGSVSSALPGHAHCPAAIIPAGEDASRAGGDAAVVVGVDGSEQGRAAALVAAEEARIRQAPLHMVSVVPPVAASTAWLSVSVDEQAMIDDLQQRLEAGAAWMRHEHPDLTVTTELLDGAPVEVLAAQTTTARLTVLGTRGLGGFAGALLGSTSQGVSVHAKGPVLIVPFREDDRLASRKDFGPLLDQQD
ncbi:Universal stress protein family [Micrococcus lylae]|uniref:Universal stress protein family n=1 Tax=Micrococcus lylae TaxID=1273 RepID=A0A1R4IVD3_9MICC|nr:universal stress protein [Micrococcus lylae]SJN23639.1 Universal stress protein family [Micrococcus lylae]